MREFGSEHSLAGHQKNFRNRGDLSMNEIFFRSGRDGLGFIADHAAESKRLILLPAYCCESMILPFEKRGWNVKYYPLNDDFSINIDTLIAHCEVYRPVAVLFMNFFGVAPVNSAVSALKSFSKQIFIIEDFTHSLFSGYSLLDENIDFKIASIRKWIGIPDGAVLLTNHNIENIQMRSDERFVSLREEGMSLKLRYNLEKKSDTKERFMKNLREAESILNDYAEVFAMSELSREIFGCLDVDSICLSRKSNFVHLLGILKEVPEIELPLGSAIPDVPFSLPVLVKNRDLVQKMFAEKGLYAPVLWPLNDECRKVCSFSAKISDNMLSIPVDQRYDYDDMEEIGRIIKTVVI